MAEEAKKAEEAQEVQAEKPLEYIDFEYNGSTYIMEFNRRTLEVLENQMGVNVAETIRGNVKITDLPKIFKCSLLMHHARMNPGVSDALYGMMPNKGELLPALVELMAVAANSVFEESEEGKVTGWKRH